MKPEHAPPNERFYTAVSRAGDGERAVRIAPTFLRLSFGRGARTDGVPAHRHSEYELILVVSGGYACSINGCWLTVPPGEGVLLQPGDWHEDRFDQQVRYYGLSFLLSADPLVAAPSLYRAGVASEEQRFRLARSVYDPIFQAIEDEGDKGDAVAGQLQDALLLTVFWRIVRALPESAVAPAFLAASGDQTFPRRLQRFFRAHADEDLAVSEMARLFHMSESSFSHKCTELLGLPPHKAFLRCRMERAQYLLGHTEMTVKEVARALGFADPYGFSRTFKKVCGVSPAHWRRGREAEA